MKYGLSDATIDKIHSVFRRYPQIGKAILYGSRAKGNHKNGSDIDITLVGGSDLDHSVLGKIMDEVDDLLLPYTVDLSIFHQMSDPEVVDHIRRVGVIVYEKSEPPFDVKKERDNR